MYHLTLKETAHLSYVSQYSALLVTTLINAFKSTVDELKSIQSKKDIFPFPTRVNEDGTEVTITTETTNLPASIRLKEKNKLSIKQIKTADKNVSVIKKEFQLKMSTGESKL